MIHGSTPVYAVVGRPIHHSLSPRLHAAAFAATGVDGVYVALDADPARAASLVPALRTLGLAGVNLTVPFKSAVLEGLDAVDAVGRLAGAVNTVVRRDGRLHGYNTDADGLVDGLEEAVGDRVRGARAVILGAGGAGCAAGVGLAGRGAAEVVWINRTPARAEAVAERARAAWPDRAFAGRPWTPEAIQDALGGADLVVVAVSGPGVDAVRALDVGAVRRGVLWTDMNYWLPAPPLQEALAGRGVVPIDGRAMLVHQAARAFEHFTGRGVDPAVLWDAIRG